jgi:two-component system cell cycle response regulator DivK
VASELILLVEDNEMNVKLLRDVLRATGYRTLEASSGGEALLLAATHGPALVVMDVRLPDMTGVEALSRLRNDELTALIPVLAVTAQAMKGDRQRFIEAGFDGYLSKPVDIDEFLTTVEQQCRRRAGDRRTLADDPSGRR